MPREPEPSNIEKAFILNALKEGIRYDGRSSDDFRPISITFGEDYGMADVRLGKTRVIARCSATITSPYPDRQFDGIFQISTELSPLASPYFETGRQNEREALLSRLIEKSLRRSQAIDTESLCIIAGQKCWSVRVDVNFLDFDGGLVDAACIATVAALQHFRRPDLTVRGEAVTVHSLRERVPVPLSILHTPFCVTFAFYGGGEVILVDPDLMEEQLMEGSMTVTINKFGELCQISKAGGEPIEATKLLMCARVALNKTKEINEVIAKALAENAEYRRRRDNLLAEASATNPRDMKADVIKT